MNARWRSVLLLIGLCLYVHPVYSTEYWRADGETHAETHAVVSFGYVANPLGRVLLIKKGEEVCGVRFTGFSRDRDNAEGSVFKTGAETFHAALDLYRFDKSKDRDLEHQLFERGSVVGVGRLVLPTSRRTAIYCGRIKNLRWHYPLYVAMYSGGKRQPGVFLAPTSWRDFRDVDLNDPDLVWYEYQENRSTIYIPMNELPGFPAD